MVAIIIATMTIHDAETYKKYTALTPALVQKHGGRFLTRGGEVTALEGGAPFTGRMVILEFPTKADAEALVHDPEYVEVAKYRQAASTSRLILQEGPDNTRDPNPNV